MIDRYRIAKPEEVLLEPLLCSLRETKRIYTVPEKAVVNLAKYNDDRAEKDENEYISGK